MAGRGRGRGGRGRGLSFNVELLGFGRGEALPTPTLQPPPLFPPLDFQPAPLTTGETQDYCVTVKQELRTNFSDSSFFIQPLSQVKDIERYSDKYNTQASMDDIEWDFTRFPKELLIAKKKKITKPKKSKKRMLQNASVEKKLEELEAAEKTNASDEEDAEEKSDEDEEQAGDEQVLEDEEEAEEETDYALSYFDNGEDYLEEDDNLDEGPVY